MSKVSESNVPSVFKERWLPSPSILVLKAIQGVILPKEVNILVPKEVNILVHKGSESHSTQRSESLGSSSESGNQMDLSLPKEPKPPIISVQNVSTRDGRQVQTLSQSGSSYGERLMNEIRKDMSWLLAASIVGFVMCCSSFLSFLIAVVYCGIHGYMKRGEKEERMRRCQEYLDKNDEGKKQFLNRINLTHLLQKLNKGNKNEGSSSCEWLNELISQFWPFLNPLVQKEIDQRGFSLKGAGIESAGSKIKFDRLTLGDRAPSVSHVTLVEGWI